ncbi:uncharacterized protein E0L32_012062 [Thyridium curvatum]|uniref:CTLH domain-containing protein n=1 Tax=Thyridium curvatum TaxID=1093900 RepID=A0A507BKL3_9PEZI|nr:uncharacterized protein E0L32_012062 [Thyridium curvatum]TPX17651.1 hypothetical protein E0L32_012062 [Thyridium curvatum]
MPHPFDPFSKATSDSEYKTSFLIHFHPNGQRLPLHFAQTHYTHKTQHPAAHCLGFWSLLEHQRYLRDAASRSKQDEVADDTPQPQFPINLSTSDDPSTTQPPNPPINTVYSAQHTTLSSGPQQDRTAQGGDLLNEPAGVSTAATNPPAPPRPAPRQVLGRRQRPEAEEDDVGEPAGDSAVSSAAQGSPHNTRRRAKRRRAEMLGDGDGDASSNGATTAVSNGTRAQGNSFAASTNGTRKAVLSESLNGSSQNGKQVAEQSATTAFGHDREEVTRILIQALSDMGYSEAAASVSEKSGFALESPTVASFRKAVLEGDWASAEQLLIGAATASEDRTESDSGLVLAPGADKSLMRFWLRQQKFLELLEQRDTAHALAVLRNELTPLYQDTQKLHFLSSLLMCQSAEDLKAKADWDGARGQSRQLLLSELSRSISPSVMLPEHRLEVLLQQVKEHQIGVCLFHTSAASPSLYSDHYCEKCDFPTEVIHELDAHAGEVWQVVFSHDGKRLASCGGDRHVIIWDVPSFEVLFKLDGHEGGVGNICWSPDDSLLVSCGRDRYARIWDMKDGLFKTALERFDEPVSSCIFAPDGRSIIVGSFDRERALCQWDLEGNRMVSWTKKHRTEDLAVSPDGRWLVAMDDQNTLHVYNFVTRELEYDMDFKSRPTSVSISQDSRFLLINKTDGELQLHNLGFRGNPVRKYIGATGGKYLIRSSFGGANESFVISGSEDGKLVIWHKNSGILVHKASAHQPRCNAVSWNPADPCVLATCGDDSIIKIWSNRSRAARQRTGRPLASNGSGRISNGSRLDLLET